MQSGLTDVSVDEVEVQAAWFQGLSLATAHYIPTGTSTRQHQGRPIAHGPCDTPAYVDQAGHALGELTERCADCVRWLAGECLKCERGVVHHHRDVQSGAAVQWTTPCGACSGTGRHG